MYTLRAYQQEAVDATIKHFKNCKDPAVITLPTGSGKSLVIASLAKLARGRVLVLAHVKELVEQNHEKYESYDLKAGIYSAGLNRKDTIEKVLFSSIQSLSHGEEEIFCNFNLVIIDECHRVSMESDTQYSKVINKLQSLNPELCILGLTATPYRLSTGWIYELHYRGELKTKEERFFKKCIYELSLKYMIANGYLTEPVQIDSPVACYDFQSLLERTEGRKITEEDLEESLKDQKRITPSIMKNIVDLSEDRRGVMIFTSTVKHATELLEYLPKDQARLVIGETSNHERDRVIDDFKNKKIKYLVNVSVLTTGFDAPHVDLIALLRPTKSIGLYQQIVGRGLRLSPGKKDCLILDYTGLNYDIFRPVINDKKPNDESVAVEVPCPSCGLVNDFWGIKDEEGLVVEHYGRRCRGAFDHGDGERVECGYLFRFKICDKCFLENDISARSCVHCQHELMDTDKKLKEAMSLKDAHVMKPDTMLFTIDFDKKNNERLKVTYYDLDANELIEYFYLNSRPSLTAFNLTFTRMHLKYPGRKIEFQNVEEVLEKQKLLKMPLFVVARMEKKYWKIREKIFTN
jgi:DNA repair protein RadD